MGYMVRLGLWGEGNPAFRDFPRFLDAVQVRVRLRVRLGGLACVARRGPDAGPKRDAPFRHVCAAARPSPLAGPGTPVPATSAGTRALQGKGGSGGGSMAALELVAMDMKAQGMYVCRTLSFAGEMRRPAPKMLPGWLCGLVWLAGLAGLPGWA